MSERYDEENGNGEKRVYKALFVASVTIISLLIGGFITWNTWCIRDLRAEINSVPSRYEYDNLVLEFRCMRDEIRQEFKDLRKDLQR